MYIVRMACILLAFQMTSGHKVEERDVTIYIYENHRCDIGPFRNGKINQVSDILDGKLIDCRIVDPTKLQDGSYIVVINNTGDVYSAIVENGQVAMQRTGLPGNVSSINVAVNNGKKLEKSYLVTEKVVDGKRSNIYQLRFESIPGDTLKTMFAEKYITLSNSCRKDKYKVGIPVALEVDEQNGFLTFTTVIPIVPFLMGRECVVPFCKSRKPDKSNQVVATGGSNEENNISFHQIPSTQNLRCSWLKNISRGQHENKQGQWVPSDDWAIVCSRHFKPNDFKLGTKRKTLKNGVSPTVFEDYPKYMQVTKRSRPPPKSRQNQAVESKRMRIGHEVEAEAVPIETIIDITPVENSTMQATQSHRSISAQTHCSGEQILNLRKTIQQRNRTIQQQQKRINRMEQDARENKTKCCCQTSRALKIKDIETNSDSTKGAFLLEQIDAYGKNRHRWSEFVIRKCIIWRAKSPKGYELARRASMISLPSYSTLKRYIGPSTLKEGFSPLIKQRLEAEVKLLNTEEKFCTIMFDEMSIKPQGKFVPQVGKVIGRASLWNRKKFDTAPLANKLLCVVLTEISTHYKIPVAYYLTKDLDSTQQFEVLQSTIRSVEEIGFKVVRAVCDCISFNVKTFKEMCGGELVSSIQHPCDPGRQLFISFDPCHVLKNLRNQFIDKKRHWVNCGQTINANSIRELYKLQEGKTVKPVRFLTRKVVSPTSFEKMNVSRAVRIFSTEVTSALAVQKEAEAPGFTNIDATIEFMTLVRKWFEIHNVSGHRQHIRFRNSLLKPFWDVTDERLEWLRSTFLPYVDNWRSQVPKKEKFEFLTDETYMALKQTTLSTIACIKCLLENGFHFVLTRRFNSDPVEQLISSVRADSGSADATTAVAALYSLERTVKLGLLSASKDSNVKVGEAISEIFRSGKMEVDVALNDDSFHMAGADKLYSVTYPEKLDNITFGTAGITMIAGFCILVIKELKICPLMTMAIEDKDKEHLSNRFIQLQDRGGLKYPTPLFSGFVKSVFDYIHQFNDSNSTRNNVLNFWVQIILPNVPDFLQCGCGSVSHSNKLRKTVVTHLVKIQLVNSTATSNDQQDKPKFTRKPLSKKIKKV